MPPKGKKGGATGDVGKGEKTFKNLCAVCHSMSSHSTGPMLGGIAGEGIASQEGFEMNQECKDYLFQYIRGDIRKLIMSLEQIVTITQQKKKLITLP